jgi:hypothetical protein
MQPSKPEVVMRSFVLLPFVLLMPACAPDERMPLSECDYGLYWAECGGDGEPVLGCDRGNGDCRWFSGGVTARGYAVADKPVLGGCPEGWPFSDFGPSGRLREHVVATQMSLLSRSVVSREGVNDVPVMFDLTGTTIRGLIRCNPDPLCSAGEFVTVERFGSSVAVRQPADPRVRWQLEIIQGQTRDTWRARLYRTDMRFRDLPLQLVCNESYGYDYLMSGVLHLNTDDLSDLDALHGRLEGTGEGNTEITFEF